MPGTDGTAGCPPVVECCPGYVPRGRYYATFTNASSGCPACGCDCVTSVVVPLDLYAYGDYDTNPNCPGCKVGEKWSEWRGSARHAACFGSGEIEFCVHLVCDPAGAGLVCGSFALYVQLTCGDPTAPDNCGSATLTAVGPPASCTCAPFDLLWTGVSNLEDPGDCCRDSAGDAITATWDIEVTE